MSIRLLHVDCVWNMMPHAQKPDFIFRRNRRFHLNRWGRQFGRLLATEVCESAVVMLDTPSSEVVWRVLTTHSIRQLKMFNPPFSSAFYESFLLFWLFFKPSVLTLFLLFFFFSIYVSFSLWWTAFETWWHTRRNQISSLAETDESI